ncbi:MAG: LssY C-terminal domain-containing protein [Deltaproteobacteria bacterium]|nr:LssY C-terminal domain-containing protein [Deltaproteobacteria bacterium]MBW2259341.1 LssY C-terminal domain-containing protein [Deltaproteobacteria bacterium]
MVMPRRTSVLAIWLLVILAVTGCATFKTQPMAEIPFKERAQTQQQGDVRVTASVLSAEECKAAFGAKLYKKKVQPVWLEIENAEEGPLWFLPVGIDPEYFSPLEVAYMNRSGLSKNEKRQMDRYFHEHGIEKYIPPGETKSGFVFTPLDEGTKHFNVDLIGKGNRFLSFTFFVSVPGLKADHQNVDFYTLYAEDDFVSYDAESFRKAVEDLPCCTANKAGAEQGDPLNLVIIGEGEDMFRAFIRAGWDETETIYGASAWKTSKSFLFGGQYRYSPISALHVFGRSQDIAFQKARGSIHERNHLRLWLAPMLFEGKLVWLGQISRDIGVRWTTKTIITHKIDPDVDETRDFLIQDLLYSQGVEKFGYVKGVGKAPIGAPRGNLTGDPYFTDGLRVVLWVSGEPVGFADVEFVEWEIPREAKSSN